MQSLEHYIRKVKDQGDFAEMVKVKGETMLEAYVNFGRDVIEKHNRSLPEHVSPELFDEDAVLEGALQQSICLFTHIHSKNMPKVCSQCYFRGLLLMKLTVRRSHGARFYKYTSLIQTEIWC